MLTLLMAFDLFGLSTCLPCTCIYGKVLSQNFLAPKINYISTGADMRTTFMVPFLTLQEV